MKLTPHYDLHTRVTVAINPREDGHFLHRHLQQLYPCRVSTPEFVFPYGFTFDLTACTACQRCKGQFYTRGCSLGANHGCGCPRRDTIEPTLENDVILKDVVSTLETHGYILDPSTEIAAAHVGRTLTSWRFVKRED